MRAFERVEVNLEGFIILRAIHHASVSIIFRVISSISGEVRCAGWSFFWRVFRWFFWRVCRRLLGSYLGWCFFARANRIHSRHSAATVTQVSRSSSSSTVISGATSATSILVSSSRIQYFRTLECAPLPCDLAFLPGTTCIDYAESKPNSRAWGLQNTATARGRDRIAP